MHHLPPFATLRKTLRLTNRCCGHRACALKNSTRHAQCDPAMFHGFDLYHSRHLLHRHLLHDPFYNSPDSLMLS